MQAAVDRPEALSAIRTDLGAIFISLELSRSSWLVTSLSPGSGETLVRVLLAYKRGEPRVCAMVKAPTPEEEDNRRLCRERKVLTAERVLHVNRIKGLLFCQGIRIRAAAPRPARAAGRTPDRRWPSPAPASQGASQPRARSARAASQADQSRGGRAGRAAGRGAYPRGGAGVDVAEY